MKLLKRIPRHDFYMLIVLVPIIMAMIVVSVFAYGDQQHARGYDAGVVQGRREVIDSILINVAKSGDVKISHGGQSVLLTATVE